MIHRHTTATVNILPRSFETYIVAYSGGKDSTATLLWALENLPFERLQVVYNPTGAAWPAIPSYLHLVEGITGIEILHVRAGAHPLPRGRIERQPWVAATNLFDMVRARGKWPSFWQRYCTQYLKTWPLRLYAAGCDDPLLIFGHRASESRHRAKLPVFCSDTARVMRRYQFPNFHPVLHWSQAEIQHLLESYDVPPNPVYDHATRCGCWCCPLAPTYQILNFCRLYPDMAQRWADLEQEAKIK